jgi:hypothetical protein
MEMDESRSIQHLSKLRRKIHYNLHFQRSWLDHGENAFEFRILEECSYDMLDAKEIAWINHYQSNKKEFGYNIDLGGGVFRKVSEETRAKISQKLKGIKHSEERNKLKSLSQRGSKRKPHSKESRLKMSKSRKGKKRKPHSEETKRKLALVHLGKKKGPPSEEHRKKISESLKGKKKSPMSQEQKEKISYTKKQQIAQKKALLLNQGHFIN